ncbi:MAG TPA: LURP-one-related family protein [Pyrinomonadaceae bacterium]
MRYQIKPKVFAVGGAYHIRDDAGRDVFFVKGKAFSFANQFSFYDMGGNEVAFIKHQLVSYPTTYEIYKGGQYFGLVRQDPLTLLKRVFNVTVPGDSLTVECSYTGRELTVMKAESTVAVASRRLFSWVRTYNVEISENEDDLIILVSIMVVVTMLANSS